MSKQTFCFAIRRGYKKLIVDMLDEDADLKIIDDVGDTLLHIAFRNEKRSQTRIIEILKVLLDRGLDINVKNSSGKTVLHLAIQRRYKDVIDFCIRRNADLNVTDSDGNTLAHFFVQQESRKFHLDDRRIDIEHPNLVELENEGSNFADWMVTRGFDFFYKKNNNNQSALYLANELNLQHIIFTLLKRVTDFPSVEIDQTPFLRVYLNSIGNLENHDNKHYFYIIIKIILENNKSISKNTLTMTLRSVINMNGGFDEIDLTLQHISSVGHINGIKSLIRVFTNKFHERKHFWKMADEMEILRELVRKGADINEQDATGQTIAFNWLAYHPKFEMLQLLLECGANFNVRTVKNSSFLHFLSERNIASKIIEYFVNKGLNVNDIDDDGNSPLGLACTNGLIEVAQTLIEFDADLNHRDNSGRSLLHLAVNNSNTLVMLIKNGVNVNSKDNLGQTPLHHADSDTVVRILYGSGAFIDQMDDKGHTPLYYAMLRSDPAVFIELLKRGADIWEPKVFQSAMDLFQNFDAIANITSRYVMQHLVKISALGLLKKITHVDKSYQRALKKFFKKCQKELKSLKGISVNGSSLLYELLLKNRNCRWINANKKKLKILLADVAIDRKFPKYFVMITGCYNQAETRYPLWKKAINIFNQIIEFILPDLCIDLILMHLSNADLMNIIDAGKFI